MKWSRVQKKLEGRLGALAFAVGQMWFVRKSPEAAERSGERLGRFFFRTFGKFRERARSNLALALPELDEAERERIAREVFLHFGRVIADFLRTKGRSQQEVMDGYVEIVGMEHLDAASALGKGVVIITGHFGNWERAAAYFSAIGTPLHVVARDADDEQLNAMVGELREAAGLKVLSRGSAMRGILTTLRRNGYVAILPDQNTEESYVPFFGMPAGTVQGPAVIHYRTGAPIIPIYSIWLGPNRYRLEVHSPLAADEGFDEVEGMTRAVNRSIEEAIRRHPEQWLWLHDRWKSARRKGLL
ncbi:MAG: lysophospholipid acyltransferase family protein [Fimbriimonadaceae bacterium]|nr:lysophospholipid acyltransferase family protein [Fimbriimonadaceae bacterium]